MKVIYSDSFRLPYKIQPESLNIGQTSSVYTVSSPVTAVGLFQTNMADLTIQASTDGFSSFVYSQNFTNVSSDFYVDTGGEIPAAEWRILANATGVVGQLYAGKLIDITDPSYPFSFDTSVFSEDRESIAGTIFSREKYRARRGSWSWDWLQASESGLWTEWYNTTSGFRFPFIIVHPLTGDTLLCKAPGNFPLQLIFNNVYSSQIELLEVL